jgi:hypothetical protein
MISCARYFRRSQTTQNKCKYEYKNGFAKLNCVHFVNSANVLHVLILQNDCSQGNSLFDAKSQVTRTNVLRVRCFPFSYGLLFFMIEVSHVCSPVTQTAIKTSRNERTRRRNDINISQSFGMTFEPMNKTLCRDLPNADTMILACAVNV